MINLIPYPIRVVVVQLRREPEIRRFRRRHAIRRTPDRIADFSFVISAHESPLRRKTIPYDESTQRGKEINARRVCGLLNGIVLGPGQEFSYHAAVGKPTRARGFSLGPEMHGGKLENGIGGGSCAVSNMLYLLALRSGMRVTERHRHGLDLFPDHGRTVPFGCGATVFYNQADLRFVNELTVQVMLVFSVEDEKLSGEIRAASDPSVRFEIYETGHRIDRTGGAVFRENRIRRRMTDALGNELSDEEVAHNRGRVLYDIEESL